ncbi:MAG: hypothetical protein ACFB0E_18205 [Leptolyngbyaceae cyanobacterium]
MPSPLLDPSIFVATIQHRAVPRSPADGIRLTSQLDFARQLALPVLPEADALWSSSAIFPE